MNANDNDLIGSAEAAEILDVARVTVTRYVRQGQLTPAETLPYGRGVHRFRRADVEELAMRLRPDLGRIRAQALREAADALAEHETVDAINRTYLIRWLRERADRAEETHHNEEGSIA